MDPDACLARIKAALREGNWTEAAVAVDDLRLRVARGGARPPSIAPFFYKMADSYVADLMDKASYFILALGRAED